MKTASKDTAVISTVLAGILAFLVVLVGVRTPAPSHTYQANSQTIASPAQVIDTVSPEIEISTREKGEKLDLQRKLIPISDPGAASQAVQIIESAGGTVLSQSSEHIVAAVSKETESEVEQELVQSGTSDGMEVDYPVFLAADQVVWGTERIVAPPVWERAGGTGVRVAIVDTGIDYRHPDLSGRYAGGYDAVNNDNDPFDDHGHGTHVAGIVAADLNGIGIAGVAPRAILLGVKVLGADGGGYISDLVEGIDWAMRNGAQVMNFSLGTSYNSKTLEDKINQAAGRGIVLVGAAGNTNGGSLVYPAAYSGVIAVSATNAQDQLASFSSLGAEVAAPGVSITSTIPGGGYASWSGTSMAAPHVAATVALILAEGQTDVRKLLRETAIDLGPPGVDSSFGYGLVHAKSAALGEDVLAPVVTFLQPENGAVVSGEVLVELDVQDESELVSVTLSINESLVTEWVTPPYTYALTVSESEQMTYTLLARATDEYENVGEAQISINSGEVTPTPSVTPVVTVTPRPTSDVSYPGESGDVRQDINQAPAMENRQDGERRPQEPAQERSESIPEQARQEQRVPETSNVGERNQRQSDQGAPPSAGRPEQVPAQEGRDRGRGNVRGASTVNLWSVFVNWLLVR